MPDIKVGDTVAWADVPDGAMVRSAAKMYYRRAGDGGWCVGCVIGERQHWEPLGLRPWRWQGGIAHNVQVIALGLTGSESAADLQGMAERFDIRAALRIDLGLPGFSRVFLGDEMVGGFSGGDGLSYWAERLHAAGFRAGMTPEDAARLLAEQAENDDSICKGFVSLLTPDEARMLLDNGMVTEAGLPHLLARAGAAEDRSKPPLTATEQWDNICAGVADSILDMSDEEVEAEMREQGIDPQEMAARAKVLVERLLAERRDRRSKPPPGCRPHPWAKNDSYFEHTLVTERGGTIMGTQGVSADEVFAAAWAHHDARAADPVEVDSDVEMREGYLPCPEHGVHSFPSKPCYMCGWRPEFHDARAATKEQP